MLVSIVLWGMTNLLSLYYDSIDTLLLDVKQKIQLTFICSCIDNRMDVYFTFNFITIVLQNQLNARPNNPSSQWGLLLLDTHCSNLLTMHSQAQIRKGRLLTKTFLIERYLQVIQHIFLHEKGHMPMLMVLVVQNVMVLYQQKLIVSCSETNMKRKRIFEEFMCQYSLCCLVIDRT